MKLFKKIGVFLMVMLMVVMVVPWNAQAQEMSVEFKELLNKDGKYVIKAVKPTSEDEWNRLNEITYVLDCFDNPESDKIMLNNWDADFTTVDLTLHFGTPQEETHRVGAIFQYDEQVKEFVKRVVASMPADKTKFQTRDMELINYWINNEKDYMGGGLQNYSGELKSYLQYSNVEMFLDNRAGADEPFYTKMFGFASFRNQNTVYHVEEQMGTEAQHIIYVPDNTGNSKEAMMSAAQQRMNDYLGKTDVVEVSYAGEAYNVWWNAQYEWYKQNWEEQYQNPYPGQIVPPLKSLTEYRQDSQQGGFSFENNAGVDGLQADDYCFALNILKGVNAGEKHYFVIRKDNSKMVAPGYKTVDISTKIEISTTESSIPLDTVIEVDQLVQGAEYERIRKILNITDCEMFDLTLFAQSVGTNITGLDNGIFEVRIPISEKYKNKVLKVYYVDGNGKTTEHSVTKKDGYAIFQTNHFSIYTLTPVETETGGGMTPSPDTGESNAVYYWMLTLLCSGMGILLLGKKRKQR